MKTWLPAHSVNCQLESVKPTPLRAYISFFILLIGSFSLQTQANAQQYHDFHNADSANPILHATPKPQNITGIQFFDVDGDKDYDCYVMSSDHKLVLYRNIGTITRPEYQLSDVTGFEDVILPAMPSNYTQHFSFFDMDNDGDQDLFIEGYQAYPNHGGSQNFIQTFLNDGSSKKPHFTTTSMNPVSFVNTASKFAFFFFTFQDIDGDGDMDFDYGANTNALTYESGVYLNTNVGGNATFTKIGYGSESISLPQSFYDFSGDGLPDCLINNGVDFTTFYPNDGTPAAPHVNPYNPPGAGPHFGAIAANAIVDLNNDGQVEIFNNQGNYATVTPVPALSQSTIYNQGKPVTRLTATTQLPGYKYQWEYNGKKVPGYTKPFINARKKGTYVLYIKDTLGTGVSLPYIVSATSDSANAGSEMIVSAKPAVQTLSVKLYPNPFKQSIHLTIAGGDITTPRTLRVTDMAGKIWLTQTISASTLQIGSALPKGLFQLEIWEKSNLVYHTRILKQ